LKVEGGVTLAGDIVGQDSRLEILLLVGGFYLKAKIHFYSLKSANVWGPTLDLSR
jgi:hypothetical protein